MNASRRFLQFAFLALTLIGVFLVQGNAERWCPFGGVEAAYNYFQNGEMVCSLGISNFYILAAVLLMTLLLHRAFCGYVCPIGTISDWLSRPGKLLMKNPLNVPRWLDTLLSCLKYLVLVLILYITWTHAELYFRTADPCYALISRHGEDITYWAYIVAGTILAASLFIKIPFCRWLCPLAAVLNIFSKFSLTRIRRHDEVCIHCGKCSKVCPTAIAVDKQKEITAARCLSCFACVEVCPKKQEGALTWGGPLKIFSKKWNRGLVVVGILLLIGAAVLTAYRFPLPSYNYERPSTLAAAQTQTAALRIDGLTCRGRGTLLVFFLERDDELSLQGYLKVAAWPGPGVVDLHITYDPSLTSEAAIKQALTEAYFDPLDDRWRDSPFIIEGYDPLKLD